jgi:hypothetical protein
MIGARVPWTLAVAPALSSPETSTPSMLEPAGRVVGVAAPTGVAKATAKRPASTGIRKIFTP